MDKILTTSAIMEMAISATSFKDVDLEEMPANTIHPASGRKPTNRADRRRATKKAEKRRETTIAACGYDSAPKGRTKKYMEDMNHLTGEGRKKREPLPFEDDEDALPKR